uniref:Putative polyprotein n=1 Tax=Oryza sativa subsp. japonica TaxID=39947 RepID=Q60F06_ORYSJ|nr:putative polyprotein [Oryza sativa Japonica Group]
MEVAVREIAMYWFENQRASRIISRTPMEVAVWEIATYWFENQRASTIISRTPMEVAVREIATYWFENQRASRIISPTPMKVAVQEIATYWFEKQRASRIISRTPMDVAVRVIATYWFDNQRASRIIYRTPMEFCGARDCYVLMDRQWMYADRQSKEFIDGVHYFLRVAEANRHKGFICCPCNKCKNQKEYSASRTIHFHLFESGFIPSYNCWTSHGEQGVEMEEDEVEDDNISDFAQYSGFEGNQTGEEEMDADGYDVADDLGQMLQDAKEDCESEKGAHKLDRMLEDHRTSLYPGCEQGHKKLDTTLEFLQWKAKNGVSDKAFGDLLKLVKNILPEGNQLSETTYEAKKIVCHLGLEVQKIHACSNDCILYREMSSGHSTWPITMCIYNLPPWLCMKRKYIMMPIIIQGPKQPGNDIDVYLRPLVEDLKLLWKKEGVPVWDEDKQEEFNSNKGYKVCTHCMDETESTYLKHCRKVVYMGHRRFLAANHPVRKKGKHFEHTVDHRTKPKHRSGKTVFAMVKDLKVVLGKGPSSQPIESEDGVYGKSKDTLEARNDLKHMEQRSNLHPEPKEKGSHYLSPASYTLSKAEKDSMFECLESIKVSSGYSTNIKRIISTKEKKFTNIKSHDYHVLMTQLLPVVIRGILPDNVRATITKLCAFMNAISQKVIDPDRLEALQNNVVQCLVSFELIFPPSFFNIMTHLLCHLVKEIGILDPVYLHNMFPFEWYMGVLKKYIRNRARPEGYEINGYTFYTRAQDMKSTNQNSVVRIDAMGHDGTTGTYYGAIEDIWELDYGPLKVPLFRCLWARLTGGGVPIDDSGMTTVDLNKFFTSRTCLAKEKKGKGPDEPKRHVVLPGKRKIVGVENKTDEDYDQFDGQPPFTVTIDPSILLTNEDTPYSRSDHKEGTIVRRKYVRSTVTADVLP